MFSCSLPSALCVCVVGGGGLCLFLLFTIRNILSYNYKHMSVHLHFWQNDRDVLRATAVKGDGTDTEIIVSTEG